MGLCLCMGKQVLAKPTVWLEKVLNRAQKKKRHQDQRPLDHQAKHLEKNQSQQKLLKQEGILPYFLSLLHESSIRLLKFQTKEMIMESFYSVWKICSQRYKIKDKVTSLLNVVTLRFTMSKFMICSMMNVLKLHWTSMKIQQKIAFELRGFKRNKWLVLMNVFRSCWMGNETDIMLQQEWIIQVQDLILFFNFQSSIASVQLYSNNLISTSLILLVARTSVFMIKILFLNNLETIIRTAKSKTEKLKVKTSINPCSISLK